MRKKTISKIVHLDPDQLPLGGGLARGGWGSSTPCPVPATIANLGGRKKTIINHHKPGGLGWGFIHSIRK